MPCPRCKNAAYPEEFKAGEGRLQDVKYCLECNYPRVSMQRRKEILHRSVGKIKELTHVLPQPGLKAIDPKYWGETLDPQARPKEELDALRKQWDAAEDAAPNFFDWVGTQKGGSRVLQLNAEQRQEYVVHIKNGCLTGEHIVKAKMDYAFVLDSEGTFYAAPKATKGELRLHHSSFLSGAPAQCAGVFFCNKIVEEHTKEIFYVKDYSGHYQPKVVELLRLRKRLIDLQEPDICLWYYGMHYQPRYKGSIRDFLGWIRESENQEHLDADQRKELTELLKVTV